MNSLQKTIRLLTQKEKRQGLLVLVMVIGMALLETAGVASVMPFLAVLGAPEMLQTNPLLNALFIRTGVFGIETPTQFLMFLGISSFVMILISAAYRTVTQYYMNSFIELRRHSIGERLLVTYLLQPYEFFLDRNSGEMSKTILSEVDQLVHNVIRPVYNMMAYVIVFITITSLLIIINTWMAILTAGVLGVLYAIFYFIINKKLNKLGEILVASNKDRFIAAAEAFGGIKDIKVLGREQSYLNRFHHPSKKYATTVAANQTLNLVPYYLIEALALGGILLISIVLLINAEGLHSSVLGNVLPTLGVYAFAAYRLKPALQTIFQGIAGLRFGKATVDNIYNEIYLRGALISPKIENYSKLKVQQSIILDDLYYSYPNATKPAFKGLNLIIPVGSALGIVGTTGSGKTTLVDIILGLLRPQQGNILIDDKPIVENNLRAWQECLGYVPQDIFLTDASITENIALGIPKNQIDIKQVINSARMAQVHEFITEELPDQYGTIVGERGIRLSGGQRQRIGIARALYHCPKVLVFDEATSALDSVTEKSVMDSINSLIHQKTVIIIAHRLSTVRNCDQIVLLEHGTIIAKGTHDELLENNHIFKLMTEM